MLSGADWRPSLCSITGIAINAADFDGEDLSKAWLGAVHVRATPLFWKTNTAGSDPTMLSGNWKLRGGHRKKGTAELHDLAKDPGGRTNLADKEVAVVKNLTLQLNTWTATLPTRYEKGDGKENRASRCRQAVR